MGPRSFILSIYPSRCIYDLWLFSGSDCRLADLYVAQDGPPTVSTSATIYTDVDEVYIYNTERSVYNINKNNHKKSITVINKETLQHPLGTNVINPISLWMNGSKKNFP